MDLLPAAGDAPPPEPSGSAREATADLPTLLALLLVPLPAHAASAPQVIASDKVVQWGLAVLPNGSALFTERVSRRIWAVVPGHAARHVYTVVESTANGDGGLGRRRQGVALHILPVTAACHHSL